MITPERLEQLPYSPMRLYNQLQNWTIERIAEDIAENARLTALAEHRLDRLMRIRAFDIDLRDEITRISGLSKTEINRIFEEAAKESYGYDKRLYDKKGIPYIPYEDNAYMQDITAIIAELTNNEFYNITQSLGFADRINGKIRFKPIAQFYQDTLDHTTLKIQTGVQDYNSAIRDAVKTMSNSGLRAIDYASGRSDRIDVATRRAVMNGIKKISHEQAELQAKQLGLTTFEITWHPGHRPSHGWGGRRYTTVPIDVMDPQTGKKYLLEQELYEKYEVKGEVGTLDDINCYHDKFYIYPDDEPLYSASKLKELEQSQKKTKTYKGKEYTPSEAKQQQRYLERQMRKWRLDANGFKAAKLDENYMIAKARYSGLRAEYKAFSDAMGLKTEFERVYYDALSRV